MIGGIIIEKLKIKYLINKIIQKFDDVYLFYHRKSGDILSIDNYYLNSTMSNNPIKVLYPWQEEIQKVCIKLMEDRESYIIIPDKSKINKYKAMEVFLNTILDKNEKDDINAIIIGDDRYGRFKYVINGTYLENLWDIFIYDEMKKILIQWCNDNEIHYIE